MQEKIDEKYYLEKINNLQKEVENLRRIKASRTSLGRIGIVFIVVGALALIFSTFSLNEIFYQTPLAPVLPNTTYGNPQVLAFIGLGLIFWGTLFFLIRPVHYVQSSLLDATAISSYLTMDRIIKDLGYESKIFYIPPYPEEVYLPEHLKGLKELIAFISVNENNKLPSIEEMAKSKFITKDPEGICITPPGLGLLNQFEKEARVNLLKMDFEELCESLPKLILDNFQLAEEIEIEPKGNLIHLKIIDSVYKKLYYERELKSVYLLGCPLVSAIICAIAKNSGKAVSIQNIGISPYDQTIEVKCRLIEG